MELRTCAYCPLALRVGARKDAVYCSGACRTAACTERKREAEEREDQKRRTPAARRDIPPHAWLIVAMEILHAAPDSARAYRLARVGASTRATVPASGGWSLRPFKPPEVPTEGRYRLIWLDAEGEEIPSRGEFTMWLSV